MALADALSVLERVLGQLSSNLLAPKRQAGVGQLLNHLVTSLTSYAGSRLTISDIESRQPSGVETALPIFRAGAGGPLQYAGSLLSLTSAGALASLFSSHEPQPTLSRQLAADLSHSQRRNIEIGLTSEGDAAFALDRNASGDPRLVGAEQVIRSEPQIMVNVSTIDSRSFLEHSEEIAHALRRSILTENPLRELL